MRLRQIDAVFIIAILLTVGVFAFLMYRPGQFYGPTTATSSNSAQVSSTKVVQYVRLRVEAGLDNGRWTRSPVTDLPEYSVLINYVIHNEGNGTADNAHVIIQTDNATSDDYSVSIPANGSHSGTLPLTFKYDTTHRVILQASFQQSSDKALLEVDASLSRILLLPTITPSDETLALSELFVTPNDSLVIVTMHEIWHSYPLVEHCPSGPGPTCPDWLVVGGILDWIHANLRYGSDSDVHGASDYAQLPRETLQLRTGDSEDLSILLVSLARAAGLGGDKAFVVLGSNGATCYGWARIYAGFQGWHTYVPDQLGFHDWCYGQCGVTQLIMPGMYVAVYQFNDAQVAKITP